MSGYEPSETEFQSAVIEYAQLRGWLVTHIPTVRTESRGKSRYATPYRGDKGLPDLIMARRGQVVLAELKTASGRLSREQSKWIREAGPTACVWRPTDWPEIREVLA